MKQSDKPPQVDYYWVSPESISPNNIQVLLWLWWLFSLGCKRPAPFHAPTREAGKQARQAPCLLGLFLSPSPLHHLSPIRSPAAPPDMLCSSAAFDITRKTFVCDLCVCVCVCVCVCWRWVSSLTWWDLPQLTVSAPSPQLSRGGPWAHTKCTFFLASLMRTRRKNAWLRKEKKKRWRDFSKQPQRIYLTVGERRERESQETFWMERQICAHGTTLHPCYLSLPPDKQQYTTAGCCLSVMTNIVQISGCSQAQSPWLLGRTSSGSELHNSSVCHYVPF